MIMCQKGIDFLHTSSHSNLDTTVTCTVDTSVPLACLSFKLSILKCEEQQKKEQGCFLPHGTSSSLCEGRPRRKGLNFHPPPPPLFGLSQSTPITLLPVPPFDSAISGLGTIPIHFISFLPSHVVIRNGDFAVV